MTEPKKHLEKLGSVIIEYGRDRSLSQLNELFFRSRNKKFPSHIDEAIKRTDPEALRVLMPYIVDTVLAFVLASFEESEHLAITPKEGEGFDIVATSDGLEGELYGENGWISSHSRFPPSS